MQIVAAFLALVVGLWGISHAQTPCQQDGTIQSQCGSGDGKGQGGSGEDHPGIIGAP